MFALPIFLATLVLAIWQPRGLGIGWSAMGGAVLALLTGVIGWGDVPVVWHIVWNATFTFGAGWLSRFLTLCGKSREHRQSDETHVVSPPDATITWPLM